MTGYKYKEVTEKIIGSAMKVHSAIGNGFQEIIYQRALEIEMKDAGLNFAREFSMPVYYKNQQIGERRTGKKLLRSLQRSGWLTYQFWKHKPSI